MGNFISKFRIDQYEFAKDISQDIVERSRVVIEICKNLGAVEEGIVSDLDSKILNSVIGYTDYVASKLVRRSELKPENLDILEKLPECDSDVIEQISEIYGINKKILERIINDYITKPNISVPLLGTMERGGMISPNRDALKEWMSFYKWDK